MIVFVFLFFVWLLYYGVTYNRREYKKLLARIDVMRAEMKDCKRRGVPWVVKQAN